MNGPRDRAWIAAHIPHAGGMCLLDAVRDWNEQGLCCVAHAHRDPANPLRVDGQLPALAGIEYAAQAMAVHGALLAGDDAPPQPGLLASAREVVCEVARLDTEGETLLVEAEVLSRDARALLYAFRLSCDGRALMRGRAAVALAPRP